jgi:predicted SAM-dependent methyltransferase
VNFGDCIRGVIRSCVGHSSLSLPGDETSRPFSLMRLAQENPGLARHFLWDSNPMPKGTGELWLHLGCGARVFEGFVNLDICPQDLRVTKWNLLDLWPDELDRKVEGVFSEDCLEHFFHGEQNYILCNINRSLRPGGVARILMPNLAKVVESAPTYPPSPYPPTPDDFLHNTFGVETNSDAVNYAMRFTGHRWLHDPQSLAQMSAVCGFDVSATDCATSGVAKLNGLNLRGDSTTFASELRKTRHISRTLVSPALVKGATIVEDLTAETALFVATSERPVVEYSLTQSLYSGDVACINFRSSNLSAFDWNLKYLTIDDTDRAWGFDETLKSQPCMNIITRSQIKLNLGGDRDFSKLSFNPAYQPGEYFTLGCAEVFVLNR